MSPNTQHHYHIAIGWPGGAAPQEAPAYRNLNKPCQILQLLKQGDNIQIRHIFGIGESELRQLVYIGNMLSAFRERNNVTASAIFFAVTTLDRTDGTERIEEPRGSSAASFHRSRFRKYQPTHAHQPLNADRNSIPTNMETERLRAPHKRLHGTIRCTHCACFNE